MVPFQGGSDRLQHTGADWGGGGQGRRLAAFVRAHPQVSLQEEPVTVQVIVYFQVICLFFRASPGSKMELFETCLLPAKSRIQHHFALVKGCTSIRSAELGVFAGMAPN